MSRITKREYVLVERDGYAEVPAIGKKMDQLIRASVRMDDRFGHMDAIVADIEAELAKIRPGVEASVVIDAGKSIPEGCVAVLAYRRRRNGWMIRIEGALPDFTAVDTTWRSADRAIKVAAFGAFSALLDALIAAAESAADLASASFKPA